MGVGCVQSEDKFFEIASKLSMGGNIAMAAWKRVESRLLESQPEEAEKLRKFCAKKLSENKLDKYNASILCQAGANLCLKIIEKNKDLSENVKALPFLERGVELGEPSCMITMATLVADPAKKDTKKALELCERCVDIKFYTVAPLYCILTNNSSKAVSFLKEGIYTGCTSCMTMRRPKNPSAKELERYMEELLSQGFEEEILCIAKDYNGSFKHVEVIARVLEKMKKTFPSGNLYMSLVNSYNYLREPQKAMEARMKACEFNQALALSIMGNYCLERGDVQKSVEYYERGSATGDLKSIVPLIQFYRSTNDERNKWKVIELMKSASNHCYFEYTRALGEMYFKGKIVEKDCKEALKYLRVSYSVGDVHAAEMIGEMYLNGEGVNKNERKAVQIFEWAAKKGSKVSKQFLEQIERDNK